MKNLLIPGSSEYFTITQVNYIRIHFIIIDHIAPVMNPVKYYTKLILNSRKNEKKNFSHICNDSSHSDVIGIFKNFPHLCITKVGIICCIEYLVFEMFDIVFRTV